MSRPRNTCITPYKLLHKPEELPKTNSFSLPLRQFIMHHTKTPKLFSSLRPVSPPLRPKTQKPSNIGLPSFLTEYLDHIDSDSFKTLNKQKKLKNSEESGLKLRSSQGIRQILEIRTEKSCSGTPTKLDYDIPDSRKIFSGSLYKPYILKISPRAQIRLYSPSPIGLSEMRENRRKKSRRSNFQGINDTEMKKEAEVRAIPVMVERYTKNYADKLKRVLEITEQARVEAEKLLV